MVTNFDTAVDEAAQTYVGRWNRLVSTTNWEKGRIILEWRETLLDGSAPANEFSDEAWARHVGGVTGQHVGRLRRVYERFGALHEEFEQLFWSHFHAALDWNDAEMWLEGAVQNDWSVSQMRGQRWEALGAVESDKPDDVEIVSTELDEDFEPAVSEQPGEELTMAIEEVHEPGVGTTDTASDDWSDGVDAPPGSEAVNGAAVFSDEPAEETVPFVRPFENLAELPGDVTESFESFKLAILRHKSDGWREVSSDEILAALDALKELALAPPAGTAPR